MASLSVAFATCKSSFASFDASVDGDSTQIACYKLVYYWHAKLREAMRSSMAVALANMKRGKARTMRYIQPMWKPAMLVQLRALIGKIPMSES